ncbi:MAG: hypothetical protein JWM27_853 [Gemmatimonadetes bacterium]|nr:hypothetical protein [Gemmatimonadota bacterium]
MAETRFPADVFFEAWNEQTRHLPRVLPITEPERARGTSAPTRAIEAAVRDTYGYLHTFLGHGPTEARGACERFVDALVDWTRLDGRDRGALLAAVRGQERLTQVPSWALPLDEFADHPWLQL